MELLFSNAWFQEKWAYHICKEHIKKEDRVCIVALSYEDSWEKEFSVSGIYRREHEVCFEKYGIKREQIDWIDPEMPTSEMILLIEKSNILFLIGGDPIIYLKRIKRYKLKKAIIAYTGLIIGYSAGAMILLDHYELEDKVYSGLGKVKNVEIEVHCQKKPIKKNVYGIGDKGGLMVKDDRVMSFGEVFLNV